MNDIKIFTDGASRGNPGPGGWGAILVFPKSKNQKEFEVQEFGGKSKMTTNNQMELAAAIKALEKIPNAKLPIEILTDSSYLINGITKWIHGWQKNNWKTKSKESVSNKKLWERLIKLAKGKKIEWKYIGGHRGIAGNERCDEIATDFADSRKVKLYKGLLSKYKTNILDVSINEKMSEKRTKNKARSKAKAHSYLSLVDGKIKKHQTWPECEKRVKGVSGARFKKALSPEEENQIIKGWQS